MARDTKRAKFSKAAWLSNDDDKNTVYELDPGEEVGCYFCIENGKHTSFTRGEAYLAGPGHTPYNAEANYVCKAHLDADAVIVDTHAMRSAASQIGATP